MSAFVLFFGGWKSRPGNITDWVNTAHHRKPGVLFDGYAYPDGVSWDGDKAVDAFSNPKNNKLAEAIKKIDAATADIIYIVGHSSGCAIANKVDEGVKDHSKITLVALDGYAPSTAQLARPTTQVWSAESGAGKSLNHDKMLDRIDDYNKKAKVRIKVNMFTAASDCTTPIALHFSLVNLAANDTLVPHIPDGYTNCDANLPWLP